MIEHLAAEKQVLVKMAAELPSPVAGNHRATFEMVGYLDFRHFPQVSSAHLTPLCKTSDWPTFHDCQACRDRT